MRHSVYSAAISTSSVVPRIGCTGCSYKNTSYFSKCFQDIYMV